MPFLFNQGNSISVAQINEIHAYNVDTLAEMLAPPAVSGRYRTTDLGKVVRIPPGGDPNNIAGYFVLREFGGPGTAGPVFFPVGESQPFNVAVEAATPQTINVATSAISMLVATLLDDTLLVNLPTAPADGHFITVKDGIGNAAANNLTVDPGLLAIEGVVAAIVLSANFDALSLIFSASLNEWLILNVHP